MRKKKLIIAVYSVLVVLIVATAGLAVTVSALSSKQEGVICEGISVNGIEMGGKTEEEAEKFLSLKTVRSKALNLSLLRSWELRQKVIILWMKLYR